MCRIVYYLNKEQRMKNNASMKAPQDIAEICSSLGMREYRMPVFPSEKSEFLQKLWLLTVCTYYYIKLGRNVKYGDIVVYQHPTYGSRIAEKIIPMIQKKGCRFIAVIHDLESLRGGIQGESSYSLKKSTIKLRDSVLLKHFDAIICHNNRMRDYLIGQGFDEDKLVSLDIFDYLCDSICDSNRIHLPKNKHSSIVIAGNLASGKCPYIYKIFGDDGSQNLDLTVHLYGNNYDPDKACGDLVYHGSFSPEELPLKLQGDFGLVWDGTSAKTCAGHTGEYLRFNNPHKTSLYLASGMPVIVWKQAAIADFVLKNGVGIVVDSLYGLDEVIKNISDEEYRIMYENVSRVGEKLRSGYYFKNAFEKCLGDFFPS